EKPHRDVFRKSDARTAFDRDVVVVIDPAEVVEAQVTGERSRFGRDALHKTTVPADSIDSIVEYREAGAVVVIGEPFFRDRHAHAVGNALAQRAGGGLDARDQVVFRV